MKKSFQFTLEEKLGQLFMIGFPGDTIPGEVALWAGEKNIGFFILFTRNIKSPGQTTELTNHLHSLGSMQPSIFTDQEGGPIVRFGEMAATVISHMGLAATQQPENSRRAARLIGEDMDLLGIDGVFAPVLDVNIEAENPVIGIRSFSDDPAIVEAHAQAYAQGLRNKKIFSCGKHYPGHGATRADSHLEIPEVTMTPDEFITYCWRPFYQLSGSVDAMMSAHVRYPRISPELATFSPELIRDYLRGKAGFNKVIFSDCLEMKAVQTHYRPDEIIQKTMAAGIDVLIVSHSFPLQRELYDRLLLSVKTGIIPEQRINESFERIMELKSRYRKVNRRKKRRADRAEKLLRHHRGQELKLAEQSITLLKNLDGVVPIPATEPVSIIEIGKSFSTVFTHDRQIRETTPEIAKKYFPHCDYNWLEAAPETISRDLSLMQDKKWPDPGVVLIRSVPQAAATARQKLISALLDQHPRLCLVLLDNPYDIQYLSQARSCLVTYGSREIQLEALFRVLSGKISALGHLPVEIFGLFPRGHRLAK